MLFDWDDANILHLARHGITPEEAEQVLSGDPCDVSMTQVTGEWRLQQVGETDTGRILTIVSTERGLKIRIITGWAATKSDTNIYLAYLVTQQWKPN